MTFFLPGCMYYSGSFFEKKNSIKIPSIMLIFLLGYHGFNGNKVHVSKAIKSMLIGAHLIFQIYIPFEKKWNLKKKTTIMLRTYENMTQFWPFKSF
jgi:hypothetical protein